MQEVGWIWLNGLFVPWKKANIHFLTHGLHYGTAVFEGIRCYKTEKGPAVFRLKDHIKRLFDSTKVLKMETLPFSRQEIIDGAKELIKRNKLEECYIRPLFFYGYGKMGIDIRNAKIEAGIAVWPWEAYLLEEGAKNGIRAKVSSFPRQYSNPMLYHAKVSGSYVNSMLAKTEALNAGYDEAILLDEKGLVAEGSVENIFIVKDNALLTPETNSILVGLTRDSVIGLARAENIEVRETSLSRDMLYGADECFITGTAAEIVPVKEVDGKPIGNGKPGQITKKLQGLYHEAVHGRLEKWEHWLDFVE